MASSPPHVPPEGNPTHAHALRARDGSPNGFAALFERLAPALDAWAQLRVSGSLRDFVEPCDVVQEVWWRSMDSIDRFDPTHCTFRAWVFGIATNVLLEWQRKRRRKLRVEPAALAERTASLPPDLAAQATSVGRSIQTREFVKKLADLVAAMHEDDRTLFIHCGLEGMSVAEAAKVTGASAEAAKKRWQRLRRRLEEDSAWAELLGDT